MAYYLVRANLLTNKQDELGEELERSAFIDMRPFGRSITKGLNGARWLPDGRAVWEEEDYCTPPLAMERAAVLDTYFDNIEVENVEEDAGWKQLEELPRIFPDLE